MKLVWILCCSAALTACFASTNTTPDDVMEDADLVANDEDVADDEDNVLCTDDDVWVEPASVVAKARTDVAGMVYAFADGPLAPVRTTSEAELEASFTMAADDAGRLFARLYFANGGAVLWVVRTGPEGVATAAEKLIGLTPRVAQIVAPQATDSDIASLVALAEEADVFFIADPPAEVTSAASARTWVDTVPVLASDHVAIYYPRVGVQTQSSVVWLGASMAVAGVYAGADLDSGPWNSSTSIVLEGVASLEVALTDLQMSTYLVVDGSSAINPIVDFAASPGPRIWGARTTLHDAVDSRYIFSARTESFVRVSVRDFLAPYVDAPNTEATWSSVRDAIEIFLLSIYIDEAFPAQTPDEAFFVYCGQGVTMTETDVDEGRIIVDIGLALIKPAEFTIMRITQP